MVSALLDEFISFPFRFNYGGSPLSPSFTLTHTHTHTHTPNFAIGIEYIKVPTWLFHGGNDTAVPINTSLQIMHRYVCMKGDEREKGRERERGGERDK
jgi:hypothetical protein